MNNPLITLLRNVPLANVEGGSVEPSSIISPDMSMIILTWITFFILLAVLHKFAWTPILKGLDEREATIRRALDDAQKAKTELEQIEKTRAERIAQADQQAKEIVDRARQAAVDAAKVIEHQAKQEAQIMLSNATQEISTLAKKVQKNLQKESADLAVALAEKIIHENLDAHKQQKLVDQFLKEFNPGSHEKL